MSALGTPPPASQSPIVSDMMINKPMHPLSEMMFPMFQDLVIKEYNNPEPGSAAQELEDRKKSVRQVYTLLPCYKRGLWKRYWQPLDLAKEVKAGVEMLVEVIKRGELEKDSGVVVGAKIAELRKVADRLVEVVAGGEAGDFGKVGTRETQGELGDLSEGQGKSVKVGACDQMA